MFVPDTGCLKFPDSLFGQNMQFSIIFGVLIWLFWCIVSVTVSSPLVTMLDQHGKHVCQQTAILFLESLKFLSVSARIAESAKSGKRKSIKGIKSRPGLFFLIWHSSVKSISFYLAHPCRGIKWLNSCFALEYESGID